MELEVCISCDDADSASASARNARVGGAARIELCANISVGGLTPHRSVVDAAASAFGDASGVMMMVRPRGGGFAYTDDEVAAMREHIRDAAEARVGGVVFGLTTSNATLDATNTQILVDAAKNYGLQVTFHRAFDALEDPLAAVDALAALGVDRILTSGTPWGSGKSAVDGLESLRRYIGYARGRIEVVIGGGVSRDNLATIMSGIATAKRSSTASLHAHTGVSRDGVADANLVAEIVGLL